MLRGIAFAVAVAIGAQVSAEGAAVQISRHSFSNTDPNFGGLSGLLIGRNGRTAQVVTDHGYVFDIHVLRDLSLRILDTNIHVGRALQTVTGDSKKLDSEALAIMQNGDIAVGFEQPSRIEVFDEPTLKPKSHILLPSDQIRHVNKGLEALTRRPGTDQFIAIQEAPARGEHRVPIYAITDGTITEIKQLSMDRDFYVTGADFGTDDKLYILERAVSLLGFRTRIRRIDLSDPAMEPEVIFQSALGEFDNLEGIAIWQDPANRTRITMVSDNNFLSILRSELVEITLQEPLVTVTADR